MNGYKDTELGRLPHDWDVTQLSDLVDPARTIRYGIVQPGEYESSGRLLIRGQDYSKGWVDADEMFRVSSSVEERYINARVKTGDLIITIVGAGTGHVEEIPSWLDAANLTQTTARIAVNPEKADSKFLKYMLLSSFGRNQVSNYVKGAAQPGLNCGDVERFTLPLPVSIDEQKAIGISLKLIDDFIVSLSQLIVKKRDIQQATMQQLLTGQRRLPEFSEGWEVKRLGELVSRLSNGCIYTQDDKAGVPVTRIETISDGIINFARVGYAKIAPEIEPYKLQQGDILYSHINSIDHIGKVARYLGGRSLYHGMNLILLRPISGVDSGFLFFLLSSEPIRRIARTLAKQAVSQASINTAELRALELRVPSHCEQVAIAGTLSDMENELATLEARRDKAQQLKQGMMQELLTGRIRLTNQGV
ncbi:restriction endonuclease subunit S [Pseudomonas sp. LM13]